MTNAVPHSRTRQPGLIDSSALHATQLMVELSSTPTSVDNTDLSSKTFSHTVGTFANQILVVMLKCNQNRYPTSIKWGGASGTALTRGYYNVGDGTFGDNEIWYLINPTVQTADVYVAYNNTYPYSTIGAFCLKNVHQTTPMSGTNRSTGTGSVTIASAATSLVVASLCYWDNTGGWATPSNGQTEMWDSTGDGAWKGEGSYKAGSSSVSMSYTGMSVTSMHMLGCSFDLAA